MKWMKMLLFQLIQVSKKFLKLHFARSLPNAQNCFKIFFFLISSEMINLDCQKILCHKEMNAALKQAANKSKLSQHEIDLIIEKIQKNIDKGVFDTEYFQDQNLKGK